MSKKAKIYTKTGDKGKTALLSGKRVPKSDPRLEAYGTVDELVSLVGVVRALPGEPFVGFSAKLLRIQAELMLIASWLAADTQKAQTMLPTLPQEAIKLLEDDIDKTVEAMPPQTSFIIPGGSAKAAFLQLCRTVVRRAERRVVELLDQGFELPENVLEYLNRLSDWFFVMARYTNFKAGTEEQSWSPDFVLTAYARNKGSSD